MRYALDKVPTLIFAGEEYGTGSSRDWAAKGSNLLGVRAVVARSFERIHRSNLVGMGILPCEFANGQSVQSLKIDGTETFDLLDVENGIHPRQELTLVIRRKNGGVEWTTVIARIDTPVEQTYFMHGGIFPYVLRKTVDRKIC